MDEQQHQEDSLTEELLAQLEEGHPVRYRLEAGEHIVTLPPGTYDVHLVDVKFEDGYVWVTISL